MTEPAASQPTTLHHLFIVNDGEIENNELFHSARDLRTAFVSGLRDGSLDLGVDKEEIEATIIEAEQEAAAADYMEGINPPAFGDPENCIDSLKDMLSGHGIDIYINEIQVPSAKEGS